MKGELAILFKISAVHKVFFLEGIVILCTTTFLKYNKKSKVVDQKCLLLEVLFNKKQKFFSDIIIRMAALI